MSIRLEQVSVHEGGVALVNDCSLAVATGERFALLGTGGAGKGSLLRVMAGFCPLDHGRVLFHGRDVTRLPARLRGVGAVFRVPALFNRMTVAENIEFALEPTERDAAARRRRARELMQMAALDGLTGQHPVRLSDAQRYRVAIVRSLAHEPRLLLLEEPCDGLDLREASQLLGTLELARQELGTTVFLTTTSADAAMRLSDRIGVMSAGRVLETGDPDALYRRPRTRAAARALGRANLLQGVLERNVLRLGAASFAATVQGRPEALADVTVLVRPEDIVLATVPEALPVPACADGVLERVERSAQGELLFVTCQELQSGGTGELGSPGECQLVAARSVGAARQVPLVPRQRVTVGVRRVHVMPTRLCSLRVTATRGGAGPSLAESRLLSAIAAGMEVNAQWVAAPGPDRLIPGTALWVAVEWGRSGISLAAGLMACGARQVLLVRDPAQLPRRMLMLAQSSRAAREHLLGIGASLLRYLPLEATLLMAGLRRPVRGGRYRVLLDMRRSVLERHGVDLRTEMLAGDLGASLEARVQQSGGGTLLALGMRSPAYAGAGLELAGRLMDRLPNLAAVLLTCTRAGAAAAMPTPEQRAVA